MAHIHTDLTAAELRALKAHAAEKGTTLGRITGTAIRTAPVTRKAFQTKESAK